MDVRSSNPPPATNLKLHIINAEFVTEIFDFGDFIFFRFPEKFSSFSDLSGLSSAFPKTAFMPVTTAGTAGGAADRIGEHRRERDIVPAHLHQAHPVDAFDQLGGLVLEFGGKSLVFHQLLQDGRNQRAFRVVISFKEPGIELHNRDLLVLRGLQHLHDASLATSPIAKHTDGHRQTVSSPTTSRMSSAWTRKPIKSSIVSLSDHIARAVPTRCKNIP